MSAPVLLAWEIGQGYGHLAFLLPLCRALRRRGRSCVLAVPEPDLARPFLDDPGVTIIPFPGSERREPGPEAPKGGMDERPPLGLLEEIGRTAWRDGARTTRLLVETRRMVEEIAPAFVVAEYAPSLWAILATGDRRWMQLCDPVFCPPPLRPWPSLQPWFPVPDEARLRREDACLAALAPAWTAAGLRPLTAARDLQRNALLRCPVPPDFDPYDRADPAPFCGPFPRLAPGRGPRWPAGRGPRIFAYLKGDDHRLPGLFDELERLDARCILSLRGRGPARPPAGALVSSRPLPLDGVLDEAELVIANGGCQLSLEALNRGTPLLLLPGQIEQTCRAQALARRGLARVTPLFPRPEDRGALVTAALADEGLRRRARDFARRHGAACPEERLERVIDEILALST